MGDFWQYWTDFDKFFYQFWPIFTIFDRKYRLRIPERQELFAGLELGITEIQNLINDCLPQINEWFNLTHYLIINEIFWPKPAFSTRISLAKALCYRANWWYITQVLNCHDWPSLSVPRDPPLTNLSSPGLPISSFQVELATTFKLSFRHQAGWASHSFVVSGNCC